jgi:dolichol kinase
MNFITNKELKRKIAHVLFGILGLFLLIYNFVNPLTIFIILIIGISISFLSFKIRIPLISWFLDTFEIKSDKKQLPGRGIIFAVAGSLLVLQLFERNIALASITILTFADPISYLVGKVFGKIKTPLNLKKNIEGTIAGTLISSMLAVFFVPFYLAFSGALIAMIFELLIIKIQDIQIDDNLIIPLTAGTVMFLIMRFLI